MWKQPQRIQPSLHGCAEQEVLRMRRQLLKSLGVATVLAAVPVFLQFTTVPVAGQPRARPREDTRAWRVSGSTSTTRPSSGRLSSAIGSLPPPRSGLNGTWLGWGVSGGIGA